MNEDLNQLFRYPRWLVKQRIDLTDCPHGGHFDRTDRTCYECRMEAECRWVTNYDEFADLSCKPEAELLQALDLAIDFVGFCRGGHWRACRCDSCVWLQQAERVQAVERS